MSEQDDVRSDLDIELFNFIGKTVTIKQKNAITYDEYGEESSPTYTSTSIVVVPYNITHEERTQQAFGDLPEGSMAVVLRYDQAVATGDLLTINGEDWEVRTIERNYLPDNVATIVGLVRYQA